VRSGTYRQNFQGTTGWRGSAAYVSGAHNLKFGYQGGHLIDDQFTTTNDQFYSIRVNNGVPNQITENINGIPVQQRVRYASFYAQESWTRGRITLQGALRYDRAWSFYPEVTVGPVRFFPNPVTYPKTEGVTGYNDICRAAHWPGTCRATDSSRSTSALPPGGAERTSAGAAPDGPIGHNGHPNLDRRDGTSSDCR
jgi:hypothetical protein